MKTPLVVAVCPHCKQKLMARQLRKHFCKENLGRVLDKQDWFVAVDEALRAAGQPEMIYAFEVEYDRQDGQTRKFRCTVSDEKAARRKAIYKTLYSRVIRATSFTYAQYCRCFGIPGSRM